MSIFTKKVRRKIFVSKTKEMNRRQQRIPKCGGSSFVLLTKYYSRDQIKKDEMGSHMACMKKRNAGRILVGKP